MMNSPLRILRLLSLLLFFALAGYYAGNYFRGGDPSQDPGKELPIETALVNELPSFSLNNMDAEATDIGRWAGKPLLINFWATWCAPCLREMPLLQRLQDERKDDFQVIGIAVDRLPAVRAFVAEAGISYPILVGQADAMAAAESFGPPFIALPFSVLVDAKQRVLGLRAGELDPEELRDIVTVMDAVEKASMTAADARAALANP